MSEREPRARPNVGGTHALGIDIGGTFTDVVLMDAATGERHVHKLRTTPDAPERAVIEGASAVLAEAGVAPGAVARVMHATTLFTNALIERKGAPTGLITTKGFRDVLEIGRERKYELYDIFLKMPEPLVPRPRRHEVRERLDEAGEVLTPLAEDEVRAAASALAGEGVRSIAVAFLHAYANEAHEARAAELVTAAAPDVSVSTSSAVAPEIREYERMSTVVANAYIAPLAELYLDRLVKGLADLGVSGTFFMMLSSGGLTTVADAARAPVRLLESGPAAGALAGALFGRAAAVDRLIALDMGGTTAKACVVDDGEPIVATHFEAAHEARFRAGSGLPISIPTIDLIEIGAGGGSIASLSRFGTLAVGPQSAGAVPGPACYATGGTEPTVTDADLLLGYLDPSSFLGGAMEIDREAARAAMERLGERLGLDPVATAWGIHDVVNETMAGAARVHLAERGREASDYALLATGGAGPVHAYHVAQKLGCRRLLCPPSSGVGSTLGLLMAPARADRVATHIARLDTLDAAALDAAFARLEADVVAAVRATGADDVTLRRFADMNYVGQGSELVVEVPRALTDAAAELADAFLAAYRATFGQAPRDVPMQVLHVRVRGQGPAGAAAREERSVDADPQKGTRPIYVGGDFVEAPVYDRARLDATQRDGPAVIEETESTLIVGPGATFHQDAHGIIDVRLPGRPA